MRLDLFGNEHPEQGERAKAIALDLFDAAAEAKAMASQRPVSQERAEIIAPMIP